jgi:hypothetical protein
MKYPIFAFAIGVLSTEFVNTIAIKADAPTQFIIGLGLFVLCIVGAAFEAVWNFDGRNR